MLIAKHHEDIVTASEMLNKRNAYACPYCNHRTYLYRGKKNKPHFRHEKGTENCPMLAKEKYSGSGRWVTETPELIAAAEDAKRLYSSKLYSYEEAVEWSAYLNSVDPNDLLSYMGQQKRTVKFEIQESFNTLEYEQARDKAEAYAGKVAETMKAHGEPDIFNTPSLKDDDLVDPCRF